MKPVTCPGRQFLHHDAVTTGHVRHEHPSKPRVLVNRSWCQAPLTFQKGAVRIQHLVQGYDGVPQGRVRCNPQAVQVAQQRRQRPKRDHFALPSTSPPVEKLRHDRCRQPRSCQVPVMHPTAEVRHQRHLLRNRVQDITLTNELCPPPARIGRQRPAHLDARPMTRLSLNHMHFHDCLQRGLYHPYWIYLRHHGTRRCPRVMPSNRSDKHLSASHPSESAA